MKYLDRLWDCTEVNRRTLSSLLKIIRGESRKKHTWCVRAGSTFMLNVPASLGRGARAVPASQRHLDRLAVQSVIA
jgi:hypothetical protein